MATKSKMVAAVPGLPGINAVTLDSIGRRLSEAGLRQKGSRRRAAT